MLKIAPMSNASMTPMPVAKPARVTLTHLLIAPAPEPRFSARAARARKFKPKASVCVGTPQHAVERKSEFNVVATAPRKHASGHSFHCRKQNQAHSPTNSSANGVTNLE